MPFFLTELVIDFDYTKESSARADMEQLVEDVWALFPLIVFGEMREPGHREIIRILSQYVTSPPVLVVEIDQRVDAEYLVPLLGRLIQTDELPQVVVKGRAVGGAKAIAAIQEAGQIKKHFTDLGIDIKPKQMKKKPKYVKDAERREKERILGPAPIEI
jgi:glutaredoxin-related protein